MAQPMDSTLFGGTQVQFRCGVASVAGSPFGRCSPGSVLIALKFQWQLWRRHPPSPSAQNEQKKRQEKERAGCLCKRERKNKSVLYIEGVCRVRGKGDEQVRKTKAIAGKVVEHFEKLLKNF